MFDCHVHSKFSIDGTIPPPEVCKKAIEVGLDGIAFTDHLDIDFPNSDVSSNIDFNIYMKTMKALKEQMKPELKVSVGIEVGIQPHVIKESLEIVASHDFDYVLASVHIIGGMDPYINGYYDGKSKEEAYGRYLREILFMVRNFSDFNNVGHFEYITRNAGYDDRALRYNNHADVFDELFREIVSRGKGFEVNTGSFRDKPGIKTCEYDIAVLKRYKELGGEIISLGSDAHNTIHIGYKFDVFRDLLIEAGFTHAAYFEKRKPVFYKL